MAVLLSTALVSVAKNVVSRGHSTYPVVDNIGDTFVKITSRVDTGVSLKVKLPAGLVAAGLVVARSQTTLNLRSNQLLIFTAE